jgi:hypothetical protein
MDDGLGEHLAKIGFTKLFMIYSEWEDGMHVPAKDGQPARSADAAKPRG